MNAADRDVLAAFVRWLQSIEGRNLARAHPDYTAEQIADAYLEAAVPS